MKQSIADFYNDIIRMCKTFAELEDTSFEPEEGASEEEIAKCEEKYSELPFLMTSRTFSGLQKVSASRGGRRFLYCYAY